MEQKKVEEMNEVLDVADESVEIIEKTRDVKKTISYNGNGDLQEDYGTVRDTLNELLVSGNDAMEKMLKLCGESDHPRTFEVTATLMKSIADVAGDLIKLQKDMKEITKPVDGGSGGESEDGLVETSPAELLEQMDAEEQAEK